MSKTPDYLTQNADGSVTVTLSKPLDMDGAKVAVLKLREPTVDDLLRSSASGGTDAEREVSQIADLAEVTPADIRKLSVRDYQRIQRAYALFTD